MNEVPKLCDHCKKFEARITDYRTIDGINTGYSSCMFCFELDTKVLIEAVRRHGISPLEIETEYVDFSKLSTEILQEISDYYTKRLVLTYTEKKYIRMILEAERQLTLKSEETK